MAVEFVVAAPAFIALLLLIGIGGQWVSDTGEVDAAARDAARQASLQVSYANVAQAAQAAAQGDLSNLCPGGAQATVYLLPGGLRVTPEDQAAAVLWVAAPQAVQVSVTCKVNLQPFAVIGIPASHAFPGSATAPLDPFSARTS